MHLVPVSTTSQQDDIVLKQMRSRLLTSRKKPDEPSLLKLDASAQTVMQPIGESIQTDTDDLETDAFHDAASVITEAKGSQTNRLYDELIARYIKHIVKIENILKNEGYSWSVNDLKFRDPADENVLPVFENMADSRCLGDYNTCIQMRQMFLQMCFKAHVF